MARILVVDDESMIRSMLRILLEKAGYEVLDASNGKDALEIYQERPVDLVLTDMVMPVMDGFSFIPELLIQSPHAKIVALSGYYNEATAPDLRRRGVRILRKPMDFQEILSVVEATLVAPASSEQI